MTWDRSKGRPEPIRALNKVKELENGEPLVPLAEIAPNVVMLRPSVIPYLRLTVAEKLQAAALSLPINLKLGVIDAWRPFVRQQRIYEFLWNCMEEARPNLPHATKRRLVCRFVAPTDQKAPPGHCTGAAVDVNLLDPNNEPIDVSSPFERFKGAPTYVYGLSPEAQSNRNILINAMLEQGFSNCRDEWWHYSFGDAGYAVRMDLNTCIYGRIDLDPNLYKAQEEEWLERMKERANPFLEGESHPSPKTAKAKS